MPNYVCNYLDFKGTEEDINSLLEAIKPGGDEKLADNGAISFNRILPMPNALSIESSSRTSNGMDAYRDFVLWRDARYPDALESKTAIAAAEEEYLAEHPCDSVEWALGKKAFDNIKRYGAPDWYHWCIDNWGTKWNAYSADCGEDNGLYFQTAWSPPVPVMRKLSEMFPNIQITLRWADEDVCGKACGRIVYFGGEIIEDYRPTGKEAVEYAAELWDVDLVDDYGLYLNATQTDYINLRDEEYECIEVADHKALFANERISREELPYGLYCYALREKDDGSGFASLEPHVLVNFGGSVITREEITFDDEGGISLDEDSAPNFLGAALTMEEFLLKEDGSAFSVD